MVTTKHVARGPVAAISTTTKNRLKIDDENRHTSIWVDESKEQTREIVRSYFRDGEQLSRTELETWRMVHRILRKRIGTSFVPPEWFEQVGEEMFTADMRVRRYGPAFVAAVRTVALMRSFQRDHNRRHDYLEINFADFAIATLIFDHVFVESLGLGKGAAEATRRAVEAISLVTGEPVAAKNLASKLKISMDSAYSKLRSAVQAGVIRRANEPEKSNRRWYWALPAPHFVPDPQKLFRKLKLKETVSFIHPLTGEQIVYKPRD